jgi:hypothetical protein
VKLFLLVGTIGFDRWLVDVGRGGMMKMDVDMFPVNVVELGQRKVLVQTDQAATTKGKNVIIF